MLMPRGDAWQTPCCGCSVPRMEARNAHPPPHNTKLCPRCAHTVRKAGYFGPIFSDGQLPR